MPAFQLEGFDLEAMPQHAPAADAVIASIFGGIGYPPLKSEVVHVVNAPGRAVPLYCSNTVEETILIASPGNFPWQFSYQLAHELAHLSARADLRYPRDDGLNWIEETLAEAHSLIAMRRMAESGGALQANARNYDTALHNAHREVPVDREWYVANREHLTAMTTLSDCGKVLARHLFDAVPHERLLADNRLLLQLPTGAALTDFLAAWNALGGHGPSVPTTLAALI